MRRKQKQRQMSGQKKNTGTFNLAEMIQRALYCQQTGFLKDAEAIYKKILKIDPNQPDSLHFLGLIYHHAGRDKLALSHIERSIQIYDRNPDYYNNYGLVLSKQNKYNEAETACKKALEMKPDFAEAWYNLGIIYHDQNRLVDSEEAYKKAVNIRPDYIKALYNLADVQELQSKLDDAKNTIARVLKLSPDSVEAHNALAAALIRIGGRSNLLQAQRHLQEALILRPDFLEAYLNLGKLYEEGNRLEDAIKCYEKILEFESGHQKAMLNLAKALIKDQQTARAHDYLSALLGINPRNTAAITGLGDIKALQGEFAEAEVLFNEALKINPAEYTAYFGLSKCKKISGDDKEIISKLKEAGHLNVSVNYALGKIFDDMENYDEAFTYYKKANEIRNNRIDYDHKAYSDYIDRIIGVFSKERVDKLINGGHGSELPVFILGTPRSGTTLIEQILSSHPRAYGAGEVSYISQLVKHKPENIDTDHGFPEWCEIIDQSEVMSNAEHYLNKLRTHCNDSEICRITDKMPGNFIYLGYIAILFPNVKIIHCKRNPLDTCLSIYFQHFESGHQYAFDLENLGHWYTDYLRLMEHWKQLFGSRIFDIEYENTVNNIEASSRSLIEYCGLSWDDQCIQYYNTNREVNTLSQWQVRQPVYKTSVDRWKKYDKHIGVLKEILAGVYE